MYNIHGHEVFGIDVPPRSGGEPLLTYAIVHGFPSATHEYAYGALDGLLARVGDIARVVLHDHVGFGFSSKPAEGYGYSIHDTADVAVGFYRSLGITGPMAFIAHDMGDSMVTELLARFDRPPESLLPMWPQHVIFTNGGMHYDSINLQFAQKLLLSRWGAVVPRLLANYAPALSAKIRRKGFAKIFSPALQAAAPGTAEHARLEHQLHLMTEVCGLYGGGMILHLSISYLRERPVLEPRWYAALRRFAGQCECAEHADGAGTGCRRNSVDFIWGDSDAVSPPEMPRIVAAAAGVEAVSRIQYVEGAGHFWMMEQPEEWARLVAETIAAAVEAAPC